MCTSLFGHGSCIWNRDIDKLASPYLLEAMQRATGATEQQTWNTTLAAYEGWLSERFNRYGDSRWILPVGVFSRGRRRSGLMYCPKCLDNPETAYFRRNWRLAWATVCTQHGCLLHSCCPQCGAAIAPHRSDMLSRTAMPLHDTILTCHQCFYRLNTALVKHADSTLVRFQRSLETTLVAGFTSWAGNNNLYSFLFFDGLRVLVTQSIQQAVMESRGEDKLHRLPSLEHLDIATRYEVMLRAASIVADWPDSFESHIRDGCLSYGVVRAHDGVHPFWYAQVIRYLYRKRESSCQGRTFELTRAVARLLSIAVPQKARQSSRKAISRFVGKTESPMTSDEYELVMMAIDRRIAGTTKEKKRLLLLRDKVMFALLWQFRLRLVDVVALTTRDVLGMVRRIPRAIFRTEPRSPEQAVAWAVWYAKRIRPNLLWNGPCEVFFTSIDGKQLTPEAVGVRLKKAIEFAM